jgi:hypothetical protein
VLINVEKLNRESGAEVCLKATNSVIDSALKKCFNFNLRMTLQYETKDQDEDKGKLDSLVC